jgi:hypothetical protein
MFIAHDVVIGKYTGKVVHNTYSFVILCNEWISDQILPRLPAPYTRFSRPDLDYIVSIALQGTRVTEMVSIFETDSET